MERRPSRAPATTTLMIIAAYVLVVVTNVPSVSAATLWQRRAPIHRRLFHISELCSTLSQLHGAIPKSMGAARDNVAELLKDAESLQHTNPHDVVRLQSAINLRFETLIEQLETAPAAGATAQNVEKDFSQLLRDARRMVVTADDDEASQLETAIRMRIVALQKLLMNENDVGAPLPETTSRNPIPTESLTAMAGAGPQAVLPAYASLDAWRPAASNGQVGDKNGGTEPQNGGKGGNGKEQRWEQGQAHIAQLQQMLAWQQMQMKELQMMGGTAAAAETKTEPQSLVANPLESTKVKSGVPESTPKNPNLLLAPQQFKQPWGGPGALFPPQGVFNAMSLAGMGETPFLGNAQAGPSFSRFSLASNNNVGGGVPFAGV